MRNLRYLFRARSRRRERFPVPAALEVLRLPVEIFRVVGGDGDCDTALVVVDGVVVELLLG